MKVWPKNDEMRKLLKHGVVGFPAEGPADWPDDTFTHRRIMDGDVHVEAVEEAKKSGPKGNQGIVGDPGKVPSSK